MPVQKFRTISEWNAAPVTLRSVGGFERFIGHNVLLRRLSNFSFPSGVYKYRNIKEAQRDRESRAVQSTRRQR